MNINRFQIRNWQILPRQATTTKLDIGNAIELFAQYMFLFNLSLVVFGDLWITWTYLW